VSGKLHRHGIEYFLFLCPVFYGHVYFDINVETNHCKMLEGIYLSKN